MFLTLSGACEKQPSDNSKEMEFNARVREIEKQKITISNPTNSTWVIKPAITNNYWVVLTFVLKPNLVATMK